MFAGSIFGLLPFSDNMSSQSHAALAYFYAHGRLSLLFVHKVAYFLSTLFLIWFQTALLFSVLAYFVCLLSRFCVSLVCGPQPELGDIAFQLTSHFDTNWVIRNTKINKEWGDEEGTTTRKFPFKRLQRFIIEIFISPSSYLVSRCWNIVHQLVIVQLCIVIL